ncbi:MAG: DNA repair protein RecN [Rhodocyclaceae bacterium]
MLRSIHIRDYVIVDELELAFGPGFGALTGETGAGKSILVDALGLVLGARADARVVRAGCERAQLSAEFDAGPAAAEWLRENELESDTCLLRRVVDAAGRSRAWVNGVPVTTAKLKELGERLADLHGQHAHLALSRPEGQRALLDAHAEAGPLAAEVAARFREYCALREARLGAQAAEAAFERERELLEWELAELKRLAFDADAWSETLREHRRLTHAASLIEGAGEALSALEDGEGAAAARLAHATGRIEALTEHDASLGEIAELLESARNELGEAARALRQYRDRIEPEPERLAELDERIAAVTAAARRHRVAPEALGEVMAGLERRLDELKAAADPRLAARREAEAREACERGAHALSEARRRAAARLSEEVTRLMQQLAMKGGRFEVALLPLAQIAAGGLESVEFRVAAHAGQPPGALARVASGGELSRIGLAVQVAASRAAEVPTLVFDEVDAGIGGATAEIVGRMLRALGRSRQVLCVTHLPQVAAQADRQWSVTKEDRGRSVASRVRALEGEQRVEEIARMLGGLRLTEATRRHAREMLAGAALSAAGAGSRA